MAADEKRSTHSMSDGTGSLPTDAFDLERLRLSQDYAASDVSRGSWKS